MAKISWNGTPYNAEPVGELANGDWHMRMQQHGPRFTIGTVVLVKAKDIIEIAAAEMPPAPEASVAALQAAMDADKAARPTPTQLIAAWRSGKTAAATPTQNQAPATSAASPQPIPTAAGPAPSQPQDTPDMTSKLSTLSGLAASIAKDVEARAGQTADRLQKAKASAAVALDKLDGVSADVEKSTASLEDVVNQLTNGGPPLGQ